MTFAEIEFVSGKAQPFFSGCKKFDRLIILRCLGLIRETNGKYVYRQGRLSVHAYKPDYQGLFVIARSYKELYGIIWKPCNY